MMNNEYLVFKDADGTETKYPSLMSGGSSVNGLKSCRFLN